MMARYVSKPIEVEAVPIREAILAVVQPRLATVPPWVTDAIARDELIVLHAPDRLQVITRKGRMDGGIDDYLVQGIEGELYPCEASVFEVKYECIDA